MGYPFAARRADSRKPDNRAARPPFPRNMPARLAQAPHRFAHFAQRAYAGGGAMPK